MKVIGVRDVLRHLVGRRYRDRNGSLEKTWSRNTEDGGYSSLSGT